ncbi:MAG: O-antigen ligase family protein [Acidobacteriota bacterium]|nr:O-antigen ligase family protein [Acidobacteriota bacterium]
MSTGQLAPVIELGSRVGRAPQRRRAPRPNLIALLVAAALACSPLAFGYYDFTAWAPLGAGSVVLLVMLAFGAAPAVSRYGRAAMLGLGLLVLLSFASILWAESRDSAWTSANQIAVYAVVFAIGALAIRERVTAGAVMLVLGLPALLSAVVLALEFIAGSGAGDLLQGRLDTPMGYINGTAGLFVMGIWPWLGLAERLSSRRLRAGAISAAALIAGTAVLTQSRAIVLATVAAIVLVLIAAPGRTRRSVNLLIVLAAVAATAHWTLRVYSSTGPSQQLAPTAAAIRDAGFALLGSALVGFVLKTLASAWSARLPRATRERLTARLGRALLVLTAACVVAGAVAEHRRIATQWHDFTALKAEQSAGNRFLALGGGYRYDLWRIAVDEFTSAPLGGVGAGNYADRYYRSRHQLEDVTVPHSLELQMLAELGVGGAIGLALFVGAVLAAGLTRRRTTLAGSDAALRVAALGMFAAWLAATSVDWLYDIPGLAGMAMLAAAVLVAPAVRPEGPVPAAADPSGPNGVPAHRAGPNPAQRSGPNPAQRTGPNPAHRVSRLPPAVRGRRAQIVLVAALSLLALLAASLGRQYVATLYSDSGKGLVARHPVRALRTLRTAEQLDPWSMQTQYAVASAYARLGDYWSARAALLRAAQLEPQNYVPPALLGDIATRAGQPTAALAAYRRALRLDPLEPALQQALGSAEAARR